MKILLSKKEINKSLLTDGISLPKEIYPYLFELIGKCLSKGDKECKKSYQWLMTKVNDDKK